MWVIFKVFNIFYLEERNLKETNNKKEEIKKNKRTYFIFYNEIKREIIKILIHLYTYILKNI